ncbi:MAG TPA: glycine cleavage system aminomethyltransferase GcvT [Aestuariivirgaceae bacterium]|nr:glycine cleavage system aminomethyltransferase GcvT [Aestuariivirgaceae bacterium]
MADPIQAASLQHTPLHGLHQKLQAKLVAFAGYEMPVQYPSGIVAEHLHTRDAAGLFDVSHMGQALLTGPDHDSVAKAIERLVPADILGLEPGQIRYSQLTNAEGGIIDDLMITRPRDSDGKLMLVVNASRKAVDYEWLRGNLAEGVTLEPVEDRALIALQGPRAAAVMARHCRQADELDFMTAAQASFDGIDCGVSRSGYTGEDGFEISVPETDAVRLAEALLAEPEVKPIGLGARDSLRLEAGLCLYGHDIDETTSPVEAGLTWSIGKRRRAEGGFCGSERILSDLAGGAVRKRVGIAPEGRAPAREGAMIKDKEGTEIGTVTSGGFGPTVGGPVAMGYVAPEAAKPDTPLDLVVRGKPIAAKVAKLPFVAHRYRR